MFKKQGANTVADIAEVAIPPVDKPSLPAAAPASMPTPRSEFVRDEKSRLIVGPNIKLKGVEITDCDTLVVEGRVEASMDSRVVQIAEGGVFHGTVSVDRAEIRGRFEGDMTVRERLTVHSTGRVAGKVRFGRLAVEDGGEIVGEIEALPRHDSQDAAKALSGADPAGRPRREPFVHPSPAAAARNGERAQAGQP